MKITDPYDGKTMYESVRAAVRKYTALIGADVAAVAIDIVGARPDLAVPNSVITVTGTGAKQVVAHGLRDADGRPVKPRAWVIRGFKACSEIDIQSADDINLTVEITNKGEATIALFI